MRILVLTSTFPRWPGDREPPFVLELCRRLAAAHDVLVLSPHAPGAASEERMAERLSVRRFRYAPQGMESLAYEGGILEKLRKAPWRVLLVPGFLLAEAWAVCRAIRRDRPDVIHAHWIVPQGLVALLARLAARAGRQPPIVCTSHGGDLFALRGRFASRLKTFTLQRAEALTVVSTAMRQAAVRLGAEASRVRVMPMGVDARERFFPRADAARDPCEILFVGRLVEKKGVKFLLRALIRVRNSVPGAHLTVAGAGPLDAGLRAEARELGIDAKVRFLGAQANDMLPALYRRAAIVAVPSVVAASGDQEGLGLVIAEALACECPVVASDLPAIRDIVEHGTTGLLAQPGDVEDLAAKIVQLLLNPGLARDLGRRGRATVLERFDWQHVGIEYERLLAAAAAGNSLNQLTLSTS